MNYSIFSYDGLSARIFVKIDLTTNTFKPNDSDSAVKFLEMVSLVSKKAVIRVAVDLSLILSMLLSFITGLVLWVIFPAGQGTGIRIYMGLSKFEWIDLHLYLTLIFITLSIMHLFLNYKLLLNSIKSLRRKRGK